MLRLNVDGSVNFIVLVTLCDTFPVDLSKIVPAIELGILSLNAKSEFVVTKLLSFQIQTLIKGFGLRIF